MFPEGPLRWLIAADLLFVAGAVVAYATPISLPLVAAFALVAALPGLRDLHRDAKGPAALWLDRALSYAAGAWVVIAVLVLLPYVLVEAGGSLWASPWYGVLMLVVASGGMLLWNAMVLCALAPEDAARNVRLFAAFHGVVVLVAAWLAVHGDGSEVTYMVRGHESTAYDLRVAPALAGVPGLVWTLALARLDA